MPPSGLRYITRKDGEEESAEQEKRSTTTKEKAIIRRVLVHFIPFTPNFFENIDYFLFTQVSPIEDEMVTSLITPEQWK